MRARSPAAQLAAVRLPRLFNREEVNLKSIVVQKRGGHRYNFMTLRLPQQVFGGLKMKLSYVFIFNSIAALGYAIGLLIVPATVMTLHGISADPSTILMARYFGVALLGIGLVTWLARN